MKRALMGKVLDIFESDRYYLPESAAWILRETYPLKGGDPEAIREGLNDLKARYRGFIAGDMAQLVYELGFADTGKPYTETQVNELYDIYESDRGFDIYRKKAC